MQIYLTINVVNGKKYIGKDKNNNPQYMGSGIALNRAIKKYGRKNFKKEIIEECLSYEEMNKREIFWIDHFNAVKSKEYYNMKDGGIGGKTNGMKGKRHSEETKQKIKENTSKALMGHIVSDETKQKISQSHIGKQHSEETKQKMSEYRKGKKTWNTGLKMSDEYKLQRSISGKGKKKPGTSIAMKLRWKRYRKEKGEML